MTTLAVHSSATHLSSEQALFSSCTHRAHNLATSAHLCEVYLGLVGGREGVSVDTGGRNSRHRPSAMCVRRGEEREWSSRGQSRSGQACMHGEQNR